ncbi:50S ribosomal protein L24 [Erysipelothrix rhusiopathiae]|uniref:50S ribosomal protein L24 n=1 Tax=Erysipelothrix rhusiopathiae TaxID=1648 RepID=UPI002B250146|nr:50S ribosomal protein L24 [Erysipelothrix rhusiopathiae]WRB93717.1 50S ribosomal protein L24 [Erysipelothrix rhusiopathiae]
MRIKRGDNVQVITGSYKGTIGDVIEVSPKHDKVKVEGVNLIKKHMKPSQMNPEGGIIEQEAWIHVSNVMLYDAKAKAPSRVTYTEEKGKKVRVYKKSGAAVK